MLLLHSTYQSEYSRSRLSSCLGRTLSMIMVSSKYRHIKEPVAAMEGRSIESRREGTLCRKYLNLEFFRLAPIPE